MEYLQLIERQQHDLEIEKSDLHSRFRAELRKLAETATSMADRITDELPLLGWLESSMSELRKLRAADQKVSHTQDAMRNLRIACRIGEH